MKDDRRIGLLIGALRRRRRWRQRDLATAAHVSQSTVSRAERGLIDELTFRTVRRILRPLEARADLDVRWRGGLAHQLLDARHAALGARVMTILHGLGWQVVPEVTFQRHGERGSIDLLAAQPDFRVVCIVELKPAVYSYEETQRRLDVKARLATGIVQERLGWQPRLIGVVLAVEDTTTNRRRLRSIETLVRAGLPATSHDVRRWLAKPAGPMRGLWFLSPTRAGTARRALAGPSRVRVSRRPDPTQRHSG